MQLYLPRCRTNYNCEVYNKELDGTSRHLVAKPLKCGVLIGRQRGEIQTIVTSPRNDFQLVKNMTQVIADLWK